MLRMRGAGDRDSSSRWSACMYVRICIHILTCYTHTHTQTGLPATCSVPDLCAAGTHSVSISGSHSQKVLYMVTGPSKYTRALTFESVEYEYVDLDY